MSEVKSETLTIRLPGLLKSILEEASKNEKRSSASIVELALLERFYALGYANEHIPTERTYNIRGRELRITKIQSPIKGQPFPTVIVMSPDEPDFVFAAPTFDQAIRMAEAAFDGVDYGRKNPKKSA